MVDLGGVAITDFTYDLSMHKFIVDRGANLNDLMTPGIAEDPELHKKVIDGVFYKPQCQTF